MHPARVHAECIRILASTEPLHLSEQARDPISASRAILWLEPTSSAASLIRGGKAQVSLSEDARAAMTGKDGGARPSVGGTGVGFSIAWLPATVCALADLPRKGQQMGRQIGGTARRSSPTAASAISTLGIAADEEGSDRECCAAFVSTCLSEALGIATTHHAPRYGGQSNLPFMLLVRALPDSYVLSAAIVDLEGPHPAATGPIRSQSHSREGHLSPASPPPASLVAAVASILPGALEGELLSWGSVIGVAGLFKFVVKGLRTDKEEEEHERSLLRGVEADSKGLVVRVHGATKLRLSPPTRHGRSGVGIDEPSARIAAPDALALGCGSDLHGIRMSINGNANEQAPKVADGMYCKAGVGFSACRSSRKSVHPTASQGPGVIPSVPAYLAPSTANWIRNVEQDVGGLTNQVANVVAALAMTLRRHEGTALIAPASGLLLHGPTGAGKTLLARSVAKHSGASWFFLDCASVFRRDRGKAERDMQDFLLKASSQSPSVVILDQVESVSKRRPDCAGITELQVYSVLVEMMDRVGQAALDSPVFFLATSPSSTALDPSLLQRGRLELEVRLGPLDGAARACALGVHARGMRLHVLHEQVARSTMRLSPSLKMRSGSEASRVDGRGDADETEYRRSPASQHPEHVVATDDVLAGVRDVEGMVETPQASPPPTPRTRNEFLRLVAARCHGYLGSDLERLCREAAMRHMSAVALASSSRSKALTHACERLEGPQGQGAHQVEGSPMNSTDNEADGGGVRLQDFWAALDVVRPASLVGNPVGSSWGRPEVPLSAPLVGCDAAMAELRMFILAPLTNPSFLRKLGLKPATGALLHGPHGCGKTSVARALAVEVKGLANFIEVRCSDLVDKVVGRSERAVSDLFAAARAAAPCVLFLDQVEGVAARRGYHSSTEQTFDRILSTLLVEMDGVTSESGGYVVLLAATNDIARLDPAILRPGRLDRRVYLGHPDLAARRAILRQCLVAMPLKTENSGGPEAGGIDIPRKCKGTNSPEPKKREMQSLRHGVPELDSTDAYVEWLASQTEGASCAQVTGVCREASLAALREGIGATEVAPRHFQAAFGVQLQEQ